MKTTAPNTPGRIPTYDVETGEMSMCSPLDARERVATGRWALEPRVDAGPEPESGGSAPDGEKADPEVSPDVANRRRRKRALDS